MNIPHSNVEDYILPISTSTTTQLYLKQFVLLVPYVVYSKMYNLSVGCDGGRHKYVL